MRRALARRRRQAFATRDTVDLTSILKDRPVFCQVGSRARLPSVQVTLNRVSPKPFKSFTP